MYSFFKLFSYKGIVILKVILVEVIALLSFFLFRQITKDAVASFFLSLFFILVVEVRVSARPHLFSYIFLALFTLIFFRLLNYKGQNRNLYLLIIIYFLLWVFWVNVHASFALFLIFLTVSILVFFIYKRSKELKLSLALLLGSLALVNINPYGFSLIKNVILRHFSSDEEALAFISEWHPFDLSSLLFLYPDKLLPVKLIFFSLIVLILLLLLYDRSVFKKDALLIVSIVMTIITFNLMVKHNRFFPIFTFFLFLTFTLTWRLEFFAKKVKRFVNFNLILLSVIAINSLVNDPKFKQALGFGIENNYPTQTVSFLKEHSIKGKIFNSYAFGGFIIWNLFPDVKVFIDGRTPTLYSSDIFWEYRISESKNKFAFGKLEDEYGFNLVLTKKQSLASNLFKSSDWCFLGMDDEGYLFIERKDNTGNLKCLKFLNPSQSLEQLLEEYKGKERAELEKELLYLERNFPGTSVNNNNLGLFYYELGNYKKALGFFLQAYKVNSISPDINYNIGVTFIKLSKYTEASLYFKRALELIRSGFQGSLTSEQKQKIFYFLGFSLYKQHNYRSAVKFLKDYVKLKEDDPKALEQLGLSYYYLGEYDLAIKYLNRSLFLTSDPIKEARLTCNIGNAYFKKGNLNLAEEMYKKAIMLDPNLKCARENLNILIKLRKGS